MKDIIPTIAVLSTIALFALLVRYISVNEKYCGGINYYKGLGWQGIVVNKFEDSLNHGYSSLLINDKGTLQKLYFITDTSRVYEIIRVGDYVDKEKDSLTVFITSGMVKKGYNLKYICN